MTALFGKGAVPDGYIPHHIVPGTSPALKKLERLGINANSPSNGVALPGRSSMNSGYSASHPGGHCKKYYKYVARLVLGAPEDKIEVINVLSLIRNELLSGAIDLTNCY